MNQPRPSQTLHRLFHFNPCWNGSNTGEIGQTPKASVYFKHQGKLSKLEIIWDIEKVRFNNVACCLPVSWCDCMDELVRSIAQVLSLGNDILGWGWTGNPPIPPKNEKGFRGQEPVRQNLHLPENQDLSMFWSLARAKREVFKNPSNRKVPLRGYPP